jgi:hypothetical protein
MVHEVFRTKELSERRRAHSVDHAGFEVEDIRARYVHAARGQVVKHVDEVELRVVVAAVLAVAPEAVGSKWEKGGGKEWINVRNSVWQFGTGNRK